MEIVGKCPPEKDELRKAKERGFDKIELYTQKKHYDHFQNTLEVLENSDVEVVSVHTPHVHVDDDKAYFWLADMLCQELDAYLVFHSQYMHTVHIEQLEELGLSSEYGYENNPGASLRHLEENILKKGYPMVLDVAHFYMAEENYIDGIRYLMEEYSEQIDLVHLCDSTKVDDGLPFEKGEMNMEKTVRSVVESNFDGLMVLEVMPDHQKDAREKFEYYIK